MRIRMIFLFFAVWFATACSDDTTGTGSNNDAGTDVPTGPCVDSDGDGFPVGAECTLILDCNDQNADAYPGQEEACFDGIDNDCDGQTDENCPVCDEGATKECGQEGGACQFGTQTCVGGQWSECQGGVRPSSEVCDGIDNDCDGEVDEDATSICDDGLLCNGEEVCVAGSCQAGEAMDCTMLDGPCQVGVCKEKDGQCSVTNIADGTTCDDGLFCTLEGVCQLGECVAPARDCSGESDQCNTGVCDEAADSCVKAPVSDGTTCEDGSFCTVGDTCSAGSCGGGGSRDCSAAGDQCNSGVCDDVADACVPAPKANGTSCDDGAYCTVSESCQAGTCTGGVPRECGALGGSCRSGVCDEATDSCTGDPVPDGTACDDGAFCTINDACVAGSCLAGAPRDCSGSGNQCNLGTCNENTNECQATPRPNGTACNDNLFCTAVDTCQAGICTGTVRDCSALTNQCNTGTCNETVDSCIAVPTSDGDPCNDGLFCTVTDRCTAGTCSGGPRDCTGSNDQCNIGTCNDVVDACQPLPRPNGTSCTDGLYCTDGDECFSGACLGGPARDCSSATGGDVCLIPSCNETTNMCNVTSNPMCCDATVDADLDGSNACDDCDDSDASIKPGAAERCNGVDDDCDGAIDEDFDEDRDGYTVCSTDPAIFDCNDSNASVNPGQMENCGPANTGNGLDDDCDGYVDEGCNPCTTTDVDNDGWSECDGDCADSDATRYPGAVELCDGKDNDCNIYTKPNCDVSDACNHDKDGNFANDPDICQDDQICACLISGQKCTGDYRCTSFCNYSATGPVGDGCEADQTCSLDLRYSANIHGCNVDTATPGTKLGGVLCGGDAECRSLSCEKIGMGNSPSYCMDLCTADDRCGAGAVCRSSRTAATTTTGGNMDGRCWPGTGPGLGTSAVGTACTADSACNRNLCTTDPNNGQRYCSQTCCDDSDCGSGYTCSYSGLAEEARVVFTPPDAAACTSDAQCGGNGGFCYQNKCSWRITETTGQCVKDVSNQGTRLAGQACTTNSQCRSNFCEKDLGVCIEPCCADSGCPTGLECEMQFVQTTTDRATQGRVCINTSTDAVLRRK